MKNLLESVIAMAVVAGLFFGAWPLVMNRSGLSPFLAAAMFTLVAFICEAPFVSLEGFATLYTGKWQLGVAAGVLAAIGLIAFSRMLSMLTKEEVALPFITMMVVQIAVPAVYYLIMTREFTPKRISGFILAGVVAYLLK